MSEIKPISEGRDPISLKKSHPVSSSHIFHNHSILKSSLSQQSVRGFGEPSRAIVKTAVMMIGEFDFDDLFNSPDQDVPDVAWFIFIVFLIIMTLILMNLLVSFLVFICLVSINFK